MTGPRQAVLVGINGYSGRDGLGVLRFAEKDAQDLACELQMRCGFEVRCILGPEATYSGIWQVLREEVGRGQTFVFFFAGHGDAQGSHYRVHPIDSVGYQNYLAIADLRDHVTRAEFGFDRVAVLLDACRNERVVPGQRGQAILDARASAAVRDIVREDEDETLVHVLFGCQERHVSYEDPDLGHGLFTWGMLETLRHWPRGVLDLNGLEGSTNDRLRRFADSDPKGRRQRCLRYGSHSLERNIVLLEAPVAGPGSVPLPREASVPRGDTAQLKARIGLWVANRKARWDEHEWIELVVELYDQGLAAGLKRSDLDAFLDAEKAAWLRAEQARQAESERLAEQARAAAEQVERARKTAETARRRRQEDGLFDEIVASPTVTLCERYLAEYAQGRCRGQVEEILGRLREAERELQAAERKRTQSQAVFPMSPDQARRVQAASAEALGVPLTRELDCGKGVKLPLILIPAGKFLMGSANHEKDRPIDEGPQHEVTISRPFYMGEFPVTQAQYEAVMGENPSRFRGKARPVEYVAWDTASEFCVRLTKKSGRTVCLPTEAQWEYVCRAGDGAWFGFGDDDGALALYGWYARNSDGKTHRVGRKKPNAWGLHDMHGNVWEWCVDWYGPYGKENDVDPKGPHSGSSRVVRGGSWCRAPRDCRSAFRGWIKPDYRENGLGFRVVYPIED